MGYPAMQPGMGMVQPGYGYMQMGGPAVLPMGGAPVVLMSQNPLFAMQQAQRMQPSLPLGDAMQPSQAQQVASEAGQGSLASQQPPAQQVMPGRPLWQ